LEKARLGISIGEDYGLHAGNFETLATPRVLAGYNIIPAQHVGTGLREARAITFVRAARGLALFFAYKPGQFVIARLLAMSAVQSSRPHFQTFVKEVPLIQRHVLTT
jgi:hypothetical protein